MSRTYQKPNLIDRARIAWQIFKRGLPFVPRNLEGNAPFAWPTWRENTPQWHSTSFESYVEEGFNLNALVYSAIMYKARSKMSAPLRAYRGDPDNPDRLPPGHPLAKLVSRPNPHQGWAEFQMLTEIYYNLGNAFIYLPRSMYGNMPRAMYALRPDRVFIVPGDGGILGYLYVPEGSAREDGVPILKQDMIHVKLPNPGDALEGMGYGMAPTPIGQSVDVDNDVTRFLKLFFQNGAMILGILKFDVPLDDDDVAMAKQRWSDMYGGVDNWIEVGVLDQGGSYQRIGATFEEMGFTDIDERNESRILGPLGVPPILIGTRTGLARSTYSNYGQARLAYWEDTAIPELTLFESEYQYYLQSNDGGFVAYDFSQVPALRKDVPGLVESAYKLWQMGTPANQALRTVGMTVEEVPGGDVSYVSGGIVPVAKIAGEDEQDMEGAVEAEEDTRKELIPEWKEVVDKLPPLEDKHHQPQMVNIPCPLCGNEVVALYEDHAGLCLCPECDCTFDPSVTLEKNRQADKQARRISGELREMEERERERSLRESRQDILSVIGNSAGLERLRSITDEEWARAENG